MGGPGVAGTPSDPAAREDCNAKTYSSNSSSSIKRGHGGICGGSAHVADMASVSAPRGAAWPGRERGAGRGGGGEASISGDPVGDSGKGLVLARLRG